MARRIAVIGQGIIGLTCADRLLDAGYLINIFSKEEFSRTTSNSAGAYWWPHKAYPQERVSKWSKETFKVYAKERQDPQTGVTFEKHLRFCLDPDDSAYARHLVEHWEEIHGVDYGIQCTEAFLVTLPIIDVPTYMPYLRDRVQAKGAKFHLRDLSDLRALFPDYDLVLNCSGVGARELADDEEVFPIRGQIVLLSRSPAVTESTRIYQKQDEFTLILPRKNDIVIGGTAQDNDWSREVREGDTQDIISRCTKIVPALEDCEVIGAAVGLRPGRREVRLELEMLPGNHPVIHNYGHGGGGYTVAWGCANEVLELVKTRLPH